MAYQNSRLDYTNQSQADASALRYNNAYEDNNRSPDGYEENKETMRSFNPNEVSALTDPLLNLSQLDPKDLKLAITKLRGQNEDLREQLRDLSSKLTEVLDKSKQKQKFKDDKPQEFKEETLVKEIENSQQQIALYQKEILNLKNRLEICSSEDRITKLEVILKQRQQMLDDLAIENKNLQKINREQEKEIDAYYKDQGFEHKVNAGAEEVKSLRDKMRDVQEVSRVNEKNFKKQQEYLTNLNHQYALVCEKVGIPTSVTFSKPDELNEYIRKNIKGRSSSPTKKDTITDIRRNNEELNNLDPKQLKALQEKIEDLQNKEDIMQRQLQSLDRKHQLTLYKLRTDIEDTQKNTREVEEKLRAKEKEISDLDKRVIELKRTAKRNATSMLEPIKAESEKAIRSKDDTSPRNYASMASPLDRKAGGSPLRDIAKADPRTSPSNLKAKANEVKEIPMVRDVLGGRTGSGLYEFTDKDIFENLFSTKIVKLTVWVGEGFINGIQASYRLNNTEDIMGNQHLVEQMKSKTKVVESLQIDPDDYISFIAGKYNEGLTTLKFQTAKGKIKVFGDAKSLGEEFEIQMEPGEQPTLMFGALCKRKDKKGKEEIILANVGFTLMKKVKQEQQQKKK